MVGFMLSHQQIMVVGAGPVGMLTTLNLHRQSRQVLLLEARAEHQTVPDRRTLALSYHSIQAFRDAGVRLPENALTSIDTVQVSRQNCAGKTVLRAEDIGLPYLGQTIDYAVLLQACEAALAEQNVPVLWQAEVEHLQTLAHWAWLSVRHHNTLQHCSAQWVILAEGGRLATQLPGIRRHTQDYHQQALVNTLHFDQPANGVAHERFTDTGPVALLPYGEDYRIVWTCTPEEATERRHMDIAAFGRLIAEVMGNRVGHLCSMGEAATFPLCLQQLSRVYSHRVVCIGNAAQTMHPVAAQGLNLGVRDALTLTDMWGKAKYLDDDALAPAYARRRCIDAHAVVGFTHGLVTLFDHPATGLRWGQSAGMSVLNAVPVLRRTFTRQLVFGL